MTALFRGPITGPKAFAIFSSFFVVIIVVNLFMAYEAVHTFPGLEVDNSYVASQTFNAEKRAQEALHWTTAARFEDGQVVLTIEGPDGRPVQGATVNAILARATTETADQALAFTFDGTDWRAPVAVAPGRWHLRLSAVAPDGTPFEQRHDLLVE